MMRLASLAIGISGLLLACSIAAADWMVFAVDRKGHYGHGVGSTKDAAREFAVSHCGQDGCRYVDPFLSHGCMALSQSFERRGGQHGYWFYIGVAPTQQKAQEFAMDFCSQDNEPQYCKVYYSHCLPTRTLDGSYLRSCNSVSASDENLYANCRRKNGSYMETTLHDVYSCVGDIWNDDGTLRCNMP